MRKALLLLLLATSIPARAADDEEKTEKKSAGTSAEIVVVGSRENADALPGSAQFLDLDDERLAGRTDILELLKELPGVTPRAEDGYGLFPNISLRGVDTTRSSKVTLMEDGVLAAPAPYSAPAAYYSPTAGRMRAIEVLMGSSQIRYGPHTTGGVINYLSTAIPGGDGIGGRLKTTYGTDDDVTVHGFGGGWFDLDGAGRLGVLLEGRIRETDGFKRIDTAPGFRHGDDTGFEQKDVMLKLAWELPTEMPNRLELKLGRTNLDANETYLGLTEEDFDDDPYRRYAASRFDRMKTEQTRAHLRWIVEPSDAFAVTTTFYWSELGRNWFKLSDLRDIDEDGDGTPNPGAHSGLSDALAGGGAALDVLRGERAGVLRVRNNNRDYELWGVEQEARWTLGGLGAEHEVIAGWRWHEDEVRRFQTDEMFTQAANGAIVDHTIGTPGAAGHRREETQALALWLQDSITFGDVTVTPGVRYESLWQDFDDSLSSSRGDNEMCMWAGGVGAVWRASPAWTLFGGVHRGVSPPGPGAAINDGLEEEHSLAYEAGFRWLVPDQGLAVRSTFFFTRFDDLIVIDNIGGAGSGDSENVGRVDARGIELAIDWDAGRALDTSFEIPTFLRFTWQRAEIRSSDVSADSESIFAGAERGNDVPYIPCTVLTLGTGIRTRDAGAFLSATWTGSVYSTASNTSRPERPDGTPDARFGKLDARVVVDFDAFWSVTDNVRLVGGVSNLLDEEYAVSLHPHGPRPGRSRTAWIGMEIDF